MHRFVLGAVVGLLLCAPAIAHAEATLYPARDTLDFATQRGITLQTSSGIRISCGSFDLGAAGIPAEPANHSATSVRVNLSTNPTFTSCEERSGLVNVTTAGTWTLEFTWGVPAAMNITVPAEGIRFTRVLGRCTGASTTTETVRGQFQNGFTSPAFVDSITSFEGPLAMRWSGELLCEAVERLRLTASRVPVRDVSNERAVILVGP